MHENNQITLFIKESINDEVRLIRNIFSALKELYDSNKIKTDIILFTPVQTTVKTSAFTRATPDEIGKTLFKKKEVNFFNHRLILRTERSSTFPLSIDIILGIFATDKMLEKIEKSNFNYSLILLSERASTNYWIKKLNPKIVR